MKQILGRAKRKRIQAVKVVSCTKCLSEGFDNVNVFFPLKTNRQNEKIISN